MRPAPDPLTFTTRAELADLVRGMGATSTFLDLLDAACRAVHFLCRLGDHTTERKLRDALAPWGAIMAGNVLGVLVMDPADGMGADGQPCDRPRFDLPMDSIRAVMNPAPVARTDSGPDEDGEPVGVGLDMDGKPIDMLRAALVSMITGAPIAEVLEAIRGEPVDGQSYKAALKDAVRKAGAAAGIPPDQIERDIAAASGEPVASSVPADGIPIRPDDDD